MRAFLYRVGFSSCTHSIELSTALDGFDSVRVISISLAVHCLGLWHGIVTGTHESPPLFRNANTLGLFWDLH